VVHWPPPWPSHLLQNSVNRLDSTRDGSAELSDPSRLARTIYQWMVGLDSGITIRPLQDDDVDGVVAPYDRATATEPNIGPAPHEM